MKRALALAPPALALVIAAAVPWTSLVGTFAPDLSVIAVLVLVGAFDGAAALLPAAAIGLLRDALSSAPFGSHGMVLAATAWLALRVGEGIDLRAFPARAALLFGATLASAVFAGVVEHLVAGAPLVSPGAGHAASALGTAVLGVFVWQIPAARRMETASW